MKGYTKEELEREKLSIEKEAAGIRYNGYIGEQEKIIDYLDLVVKQNSLIIEVLGELVKRG